MRPRTPDEVIRDARRARLDPRAIVAIHVLLFVVIPAGLAVWMFTTSLSEEDLIRRYEAIAFEAPEGAPPIRTLTRWAGPLALDIPPPPPGFTELDTHLRTQFPAFGEAAGLPVFLDATPPTLRVTYAPTAGPPWSLRQTIQANIITGARLTFHLPPDRHYDDPRHLTIDAIQSVLGMRGRYETWSPRYRMTGLNYVRVPLALTLIHYDSRLRPGMTRDTARPLVRAIVRDLAAASSYDAWLETRSPPSMEE